MSLKKNISVEQQQGSVAQQNSRSGRVSIITPKTVRDVEKTIDCLKREEQVIVDLSYMSVESAEKALNVFSGAVYALSGSMKRLKDRLYLLTATGVSIVIS